MARSTSENFERIRNSVREINQLADDATKQIRMIENTLIDIGAGIDLSMIVHVSTGVELISVKDKGSADVESMYVNVNYYLAYGRSREDKFGILLNCFREAENPRKHEQGQGPTVLLMVWSRSLVLASRQLRLNAVDKIPFLIEHIANECEQITIKAPKGLRDAANAIDDVKAAMAQQKPRP